MTVGAVPLQHPLTLQTLLPMPPPAGSPPRSLQPNGNFPSSEPLERSASLQAQKLAAHSQPSLSPPQVARRALQA